MAFQAIDDEGNADGDVDKGELGNVLRRVAEKMGITQPNDSDLSALFSEMDKDGNNGISKDEFAYLIVKVLEKMQVTEEEIVKGMFGDNEEIQRVPNQLPENEIDENSIINEAETDEESKTANPR